MESPIPPVLILLTAAAAAPLIGIATRRIGLSIVVIELLLGILMGPQGIGLLSADVGALPALSKIGMAFLFFIAGLEIDFPAIHGRPLWTGLAGWAGALALAAAVALGLQAAGLVQTWTVVAIALATTALGVLVPILRDADASETPFGRSVLATGVVGELGPILAMSIVLSRRSADVQASLTLTFLAIVLVLAWLLARGAGVPALLTPLRRGLDHSGQLPIRLVLVLIGGLSVLAEEFGLDLALGSLAAGMMAGFATKDGERTHDLHSKLDALGFGFLVPMFFLSSGMKLDVQSIYAGSGGLVLLVVFLIALVATRLPLVWMLRSSLGNRSAMAVGAFSATTLSLLVVLTQLAVEAGVMGSAEAAPIVGAGIVSVVVFPIFGLRLAGMKAVSLGEEDGRDGL